MPRLADVEAFLANELIEASLVNAARPVLEEPLQGVGGPIPTTSILGHPLGSNIRHILEDLDFESEDSVGMKGNNMGHSIADREVARPQLSLCLLF